MYNLRTTKRRRIDSEGGIYIPRNESSNSLGSIELPNPLDTSKKRILSPTAGTNDDNIFWGIPQNEGEKKKLVLINNAVYAVGNEIHFTAEINKDTIQEIIKLIAKIVSDNAEKYKRGKDKLTITYVVDSPGGSVTSILKFVDFLDLVRNKYNFVEFVSIISGVAASAGTIMAIVADKRYMTKHAHAMIHELSSGRMGQYTQLKSYTAYLEQLHDDLVNIYLTKVKLGRAELEELLKCETWFTAENYLRMGFVDEIK